MEGAAYAAVDAYRSHSRYIWRDVKCISFKRLELYKFTGAFSLSRTHCCGSLLVAAVLPIRTRVNRSNVRAKCPLHFPRGWLALSMPSLCPLYTLCMPSHDVISTSFCSRQLLMECAPGRCPTLRGGAKHCLNSAIQTRSFPSTEVRQLWG